jgi:tetratricopeptide (TPR) repeat protein
MMRGLLRLSTAGSLFACCGAALLSAAPVQAQGSYSPYNETATAALARYVRTLASDPKDFTSLIGAGRAALDLGDAQAAAGFFARADDENPHSPLPQAGMGAVSVISGNAQASLPYFTRAQQLGATLATIGCDRGLAYDLLGRQADAQADYRAALNGPDGEEARRRLALSLAISGNRAEALQTLAPLLAKGDVASARTRAFVLAITGDSAGAMVAFNAAMPGNAASLAPFLQRLASLPAGQKAAAANLGIFPDSGDIRLASNTTPQTYGTPRQVVSSVSNDRLSGIDQLLTRPAAPSAYQAQPVQPTYQPQPVQVAYARPPAAPSPAAAPPFQPKLWLELASGTDVDALAGRFRAFKSRDPDLFAGLRPYVARSADGARLLIGPFRGPSDAQMLSEDLETIGINASKWSNSQSDRIAALTTE